MHFNEMSLMKRVADLAKESNKNLELYCTECCTTFELCADGQWKSIKYGGETKVADVIQDRLIICTCGTSLGVYARELTVPGQVVPIN